MNNLIKKIHEVKIEIISTISLLMLYISIAFFFNGDFISSEQGGIIKPFNENWIVNGSIHLYDIPEKINIDPGDILYIENILPEIEENEFLQLYSSKAQFSVFISEKLVFRYPDISEIDPINTTLNIPLEREHSNKKIRIEITSNYRKYSGRVNEMFIGNIKNIVDNEVHRNLPMLFLFVICITIGVMIILIFFCIPNHKNYISWFFLGLFCILLSLRFISEYNLGYIFNTNPFFINNTYYYTSLVIPLSLIACMYGVTRHTNLLIAGAIIFTCLSGVLILFNYSGFLLFSTTLNYYQIVSFIFYGIIIIILFFEAMIHGGARLITAFLASLVLLLTAIIDSVSHYHYLMSYRNAGLIIGSGLISYMLIMIVASVYSGVDKIELSLELKNELIEKRIQLMISQIRPHFIYNTLNSIQALICIDPAKSEMMLDDFSKYLRTHIDLIEGDDVILFSEEIENIKAYVNIELVRFPKLSVEYLINEDLFMVPSLSIQPIVENAIKHGISKTNKSGKVTISSFNNDSEYVIVISDNGVGFNRNKQENHNSVGIENVKARLVTMCNADVTIESKKNIGTTVTIQIPRENEIENNFG